MDSTELSLTPHQAARIAGRILCVFFLFFAVVNLYGIPSYVMGVLHYEGHGDGVVNSSYYSYWTSKYVAWIAGSLLKAAIDLWFAGVFYRCNTKVMRFLLPAASSAHLPSEESNA